MKVLLIDDDTTFRERLAISLRKRGYEAHCTDGSGALAAAAATQPAALLIDLKMPEQTGLELIPQLKSLLPLARIVVLTGYGSIATAMEATRQGAADYLTKPAGIQQIQAALDGRPPPPKTQNLEVPSLDQVEWEHLQRVLADCDNNISQTAKLLGIDRRSLQRKLAKYAPHR